MRASFVFLKEWGYAVRVERKMWDLWYVLQRGVALLLLLTLIPAFIVLWLVVKVSSRGPFLYSQLRPGLGEIPLRIWKIRTMQPGADQNPEFARGVTKNCAEVTRVGRMLRQLKLDELPQLWNIVRGEMAFVGPRPIATSLYQELSAKIPGFRDRTLVRPGLSNVAQIAIEDNAQGERVLDDWQERFEAERHYLTHRSARYDCVVLAMTALFVIRKGMSCVSLPSKRAR